MLGATGPVRPRGLVVLDGHGGRRDDDVLLDRTMTSEGLVRALCGTRGRYALLFICKHPKVHQLAIDISGNRVRTRAIPRRERLISLPQRPRPGHGVCWGPCTESQTQSEDPGVLQFSRGLQTRTAQSSVGVRSTWQLWPCPPVARLRRVPT